MAVLCGLAALLALAGVYAAHPDAEPVSEDRSIIMGAMLLAIILAMLGS